MKRKHNPTLTPNAIELRKTMTKQEKKLWHDFLKHYPVRFLRQKVIDSFIADFYCSSAKLVIELDGSQHFNERGIGYDQARTKVLESYGLTVIRFTNLEVERNFKGVCRMIEIEVEKRLREIG